MLQATLRPKAAIVSKKQIIFTFFPFKSLWPNWPWRKMGQGQTSDLIWTTLVVLTYMMLQTKFQGHGSIGSGEEDFLSFYHIWAWQPCWSCDPTHLYKFSFLFSFKLSYEFWFQMTQLFLRKTSFNFEIWVTFDQGQRMTLTSDTHSTS